MFESTTARPPEVTAFLRWLQADDTVPRDAVALVDEIALLQTVGSALQAAQAVRTAALSRVREAELSPTTGLAVRDRVRRDVGAQVGLARRVGPHVGSRLVGLATVLTHEMPHTLAAFRAGRIDEHQAMLIVAETSALSPEHRQTVDRELADRLGTMGAQAARRAAAQIGYRLDPEQAVNRTRRASADRRVTLRPAPDTMTYLTALLPVAEGVGVYAALRAAAASAGARGEARGTGALMADTRVERLLQPAASPTVETDGGGDTTDAARPDLPVGLDVEIQLVMTDRTLFDGDAAPAVVSGYGPIPAPLARRLVQGADVATRVWVRRLYGDSGGRLTDADARRRLFPHAARQFLVARDQVCRTPWCDAPIRHADHTLAHAAGGATTLVNGAGLCVTCNQTKEEPGWSAAAHPDGSIVTTTPTGHRYRSHPPDPPRSTPWAPDTQPAVA